MGLKAFLSSRLFPNAVKRRSLISIEKSIDVKLRTFKSELQTVQTQFEALREGQNTILKALGKKPHKRS